MYAIRYIGILALFLLILAPVQFTSPTPALQITEAACENLAGEEFNTCLQGIETQIGFTCQVGSSEQIFECRAGLVSDMCGGNASCESALRTNLGIPSSTTDPSSNTSDSNSTTDPSSNTSDSSSSFFDFDIVAKFKEAGMALINIVLAALVSVVGSILALTGSGFDFALRHTVLNFASTYSIIEQGINITWGGFRDVANIVLVSMFVFVAFSVILGIETYGLKRFGIRLLIVAVLINFSLFFTKSIIDVGNITAIQFSKSIQQSESSAPDSSFGVSIAIMQKTGLSGFNYGASYEALQSVTGSGDSVSLGNSFLYTFIAIILSASLTMVFLYGLVLLFTRAVILILLMATSALAFAAYLIPKLGEKWWNKWWEQLIKNALFAPVLMLFLWSALNIIEKLSDPSSNSTEALIQSMVKGNSTGWEIIFNMSVVVGLVFAALKVSDGLSLHGGQFANNFAKKGFSKTLQFGGLGVAAGIPNALYRNTVGRTGRALANRTDLQRAAVEGNAATRFGARTALKTGKGLASLSLDARDFKTIQKFQKSQKVDLGKSTGNLEEAEKATVKTEKEYVEKAANAYAREQAGAKDTGNEKESTPDVSVGSQNNSKDIDTMARIAAGAQKKKDPVQTPNKESSTTQNEGSDQVDTNNDAQFKLGKESQKISENATVAKDAGRERSALQETQINNVTAALPEKETSSNTETEKAPENTENNLKRRYLQEYREGKRTQGLGAPGAENRGRIANDILGSMKKTSQDKMLEKIQGQLNKNNEKPDA